MARIQVLHEDKGEPGIKRESTQQTAESLQSSRRRPDADDPNAACFRPGAPLAMTIVHRLTRLRQAHVLAPPG